VSVLGKKKKQNASTKKNNGLCCRQVMLTNAVNGPASNVGVAEKQLGPSVTRAVGGCCCNHASNCYARKNSSKQSI